MVRLRGSVSKAWPGRARWSLLVAAVAVSGALGGTARAQSVLTRTVDGYRCAALTSVACVNDVDCGVGNVCRSFGATSASGCVARDAIFCCSSDAECPLALGGGAALSCRYLDGLSERGGLCLPERMYCDGRTIEEIARCHTTPDDRLTLAWVDGDCDGDGLSNGQELELTTQVCQAPAPAAYYDGRRCTNVETGCVPGAPCSSSNGDPGECEIDPTASGAVCEPSGERFACCGGDLAKCPADTVCAELEEATLCIPWACADSPFVEDPAQCVRDSSGALVAFGEGDCDSDGVPNALDETPCGSHDSSPDGGPGSADAGAGRLDGGPPPSSITPGFQGGGGCACRSAPGPVRGSGILAGVASMLLVLVARRRR